jgi:hypothetical protein
MSAPIPGGIVFVKFYIFSDGAFVFALGRNQTTRGIGKQLLEYFGGIYEHVAGGGAHKNFYPILQNLIN